jgi:hypothetical protein
MEGKQARAMREKSNAMGKQGKSGRSDKKAIESNFLLGTDASAKEGARFGQVALMGDVTKDTGGESAVLLQHQSCSKAPGNFPVYSNLLDISVLSNEERVVLSEKLGEDRDVNLQATEESSELTVADAVSVGDIPGRGSRSNKDVEHTDSQAEPSCMVEDTVQSTAKVAETQYRAEDTVQRTAQIPGTDTETVLHTDVAQSASSSDLLASAVTTECEVVSQYGHLQGMDSSREAVASSILAHAVERDCGSCLSSDTGPMLSSRGGGYT